MSQETWGTPAFRKRIEEGGEYDEHEWGGCGCFTP